MLVTISGIVGIDSTETMVRFDSEHGSAIGRWMSGTPQHGSCDVEVDVPPLEWGRDAIATEPRAALIESIPSGVRIVGVLEADLDDGVYVVRVGASPVAIEASGEAPPIGTHVQLEVDEIQLYDSGL